MVLFSTNLVLQRCIINNTHRLVELCVAKLSQDWFPLLELLAMATNPHCKFHIYNGTRPSETVPAGAQLADDELFARPPDPRSPKVNDHCRIDLLAQNLYPWYNAQKGMRTFRIFFFLVLSVKSSNFEKRSGSMRYFHTWIGHQRFKTLTPKKVVEICKRRLYAAVYLAKK